MKTQPLILAIFVWVAALALPSVATAAERVRILAAEAAIHLSPDPNSLTITRVSAGTVLDIERREGSWIAVWLPSEPQGTRRLGFVSTSDVEILSDVAPAPRPIESSPQSPVSQPDPPAATEAPTSERRCCSKEVTGYVGTTLGLQGARAIIQVGKVVVDSGEHTVLPTLGVSITRWFGEKRMFGLTIDVSGILGGKAEAAVGSASITAESFVADFHAAFQVQTPRGVVRPYAVLGAGIMGEDLKTSGSQTASVTESSAPVATAIIGGGLRFLFGSESRAALIVGFEGHGYADDAGDTGGAYGRFIVGFSGRWN